MALQLAHQRDDDQGEHNRHTCNDPLTKTTPIAAATHMLAPVVRPYILP